MVLRDWKPSFLEASCCKVEVMKGGAADFLRVPWRTFETVYSASLRSAVMLSACC